LHPPAWTDVAVAIKSPKPSITVRTEFAPFNRPAFDSLR
jgi:hypothetical protein